MRHGIDLKPIHNVKDAGQFPASRALDFSGPDLVFSSLECSAGRPAQHCWRRPGGAYRDRTDDLKLAKLALSQLS